MVNFQEAKYSHVTPLLKELHWLPVKYRFDFKDLLITFKVTHGQAPHYLSELITIKQKGRYNLRSVSSLTSNYCLINSRATLGDRSFSEAAPIL